MFPILSYTPEVYEAAIAALLAAGMVQSYAIYAQRKHINVLKSTLVQVIDKATSTIKTLHGAAGKAVVTAMFTAAAEIAKAKSEAEAVKDAAMDMKEAAENQFEQASDLLTDVESYIDEHEAREARFVGKSPWLGAPYGKHQDPYAAVFSNEPGGGHKSGTVVKAFRVSRDGNLTEVDPNTGFALGGTISRGGDLGTLGALLASVAASCATRAGASRAADAPTPGAIYATPPSTTLTLENEKTNTLNEMAHGLEGHPDPGVPAAQESAPEPKKVEQPKPLKRYFEDNFSQQSPRAG